VAIKSNNRFTRDLTNILSSARGVARAPFAHVSLRSQRTYCVEFFRRQTRLPHGVIQCSLAGPADRLMGLFMVVVFGVETPFDSSYFRHMAAWKTACALDTFGAMHTTAPTFTSALPIHLMAYTTYAHLREAVQCSCCCRAASSDVLRCPAA